MQIVRSLVALLAAALTAVLPLPAAPAPEPASTGGVRLYRQAQRDPLLVYSIAVDDAAGSFADLVALLGRFSEERTRVDFERALATFDARSGFGLQEDLLGSVGPEIAVIVDIPPVDEMFGALRFSDGGSLAAVLGRSGLVAATRDGAQLDRTLRKAIAAFGGRLTERDGVVSAEVPLPSGGGVALLHYTVRGGLWALGFARPWVATALDERPPGARLEDGADFRKVFAHLDAAPSSLTYANLPRLRELVAGSQIVKAMLQDSPQARELIEELLAGDSLGVGFGSTTHDTADGVRTTSFGPSWASGAAVAGSVVAALAVPNLFYPADGGKARDSLSDVRAIAEACEGFQHDAKVYPGPTEGWVAVDRIAAFLEPVYIGSLPRQDAWDNPILYWSDGATYRLLSTGGDGRIDRDWTVVRDPVASQDDFGDIVFADGQLLVVPGTLVAE